MAKVKNKTATKKRTYSKKKNIKIEKPIIIIGLIVLALIILSYITFGLYMTIILTVGILLILGIARLLDKVKSKPKRRKILNIILIIFFIIAIAIILFIAAFFIKIVKEAPNFDITKLNKQEATILYDNKGVEFARIGTEMRENVTYDDLPEVFIDALIATEDSRYFQHNGFDAPRFIKASIGQVLGNKNAGGASTISMQLIKNTYTGNEAEGIDGIIRKFTDIYLAVFKLEKNFTKEEIIEYYVNNYDLSNNSLGVEIASKTLFDKSVRDLNLSEAALLVGIFNNPTAYNPFYNPNNAYKRRQEVLGLMVKHGYITSEEANIANSIPVDSLLTKTAKTLEYQSYIDTVREELINKYGINPTTTSLLVYTNMDRDKQKGLDDIFNSKTFTWPNNKVDSGVAVVENSTGKIIAVGSGRNKTGAFQNNLATQAKRQIGSSAKPIFDYGPAIEYLGWNPYTQILDEPWTYSTGQSVTNSDSQYKGWMSMKTALAQSRNVPAVKTFQQVSEQVGNKKIIEFAKNLGLTPQIENGQIYEAHALGAFDGTTPLQMAAAYAAFGNGGTYHEPLSVNKIVYRENNTVKTFKGSETKAMSETTAYMITDMLIEAVNTGLSGAAKMSGVTVAAKTGTTNFDSSTKRQYNLPAGAINDAWVVGYDPEYTISMWYGYKKITDGYNKASTAGNERTKLYRALENVIFKKNNDKKFTVPSNLINVCVEKGSNPAALPSAGTPQDQITCEYFVKGTEPTEASSRYNKLDTVSNLKVTYDENTKKVTISWSKLNTPTANESFGDFGYNVYYGDVLLDFTTENSYTIQANSNISGTYKVITTFKNYAGNQSDPAVYNFEYNNETDTAVYNLITEGTNPVTITATETYNDLDIPVQLLKNGSSINSEVNIKSILKTTIKDPSGNPINNISGSSENQLTTGTYTITYTVTYKGKTYTTTRKVIVN